MSTYRSFFSPKRHLPTSAMRAALAARDLGQSLVQRIDEPEERPVT